MADNTPPPLPETMAALQEVIEDSVAARPYLLLVFEADRSGSGGRLAYVTNSNLNDMVEAMQQFIEIYRAREPADAAPRTQ